MILRRRISFFSGEWGFFRLTEKVKKVLVGGDYIKSDGKGEQCETGNIFPFILYTIFKRTVFQCRLPASFQAQKRRDNY